MPDQAVPPPFAAYDEMASGRGTIRPHWRDLIAAVWSMPPAQMAEKLARARAQFAEADEFLAIYGQETRRPAWTFDLLPLILPEAEWQALTEGLAQRARLLDLILADIYGPQTLIKEQFIPPYLVYANPEFLRPLRHVKPVGGAPYLYFYAADLVRTPAGGWRVFADRTQAAAGVGYALRNRRVMARTFPEVFRAAPARRLQPFVDMWQDSLRRVGTSLHFDPHAVLLTPGPYSNAYFEHVYLARELGITLAQGSDLTVREDTVYLKTLDGLSRIDVIYRRLDATFIDPLELRDDSALGIAGLIQAQRAGNVVVVNMPGSAVIETPAYAPFLPRLARHLLGEELKLPAVTTWWCGQSEPLAEVKARLDKFVLRPAFAADPEPIEAERLDAAKRAAFDADLAARPERYVALERVTHGVVPTMSESGMVPQPIVLRVALVWHDGKWQALPGGVARVVGADKLYRSTLRHGGIAKDVWVLTGEPHDVYVPTAKRGTAEVKRAKAALQSRAADDLFWLGRYAERLDTGARLFRAVLNRMAGGGMGARDFAELSLLARALQRTGWIEAAVAAAPIHGAMFSGGIMKAIADTGTMRDVLDAIRHLSFALRDRLSADMWQTLTYLQAHVRRTLTRSEGEMDRMLDALDELVRTVAAIGGLVAENMVRGAGWRFLDMGRRLERGIAIARSISGVTGGAAQYTEVGLRLALELCDSTITYRTRYPTEPRPVPALDLILADAGNPRALAYQLVQLRDHLAALASNGAAAAEPRHVAALADRVMEFPLDQIEGDKETSNLAPVLDLLAHVNEELGALSNAITRNFFSHVTLPHTLTFRSRASLDVLPA